MVWFGLVLIYDKQVWFSSKLSINGLVSPIFKQLGFPKWFGLNGFIHFKQFDLVFIINKWFGLVWFRGQETEPNRNQIGPIAKAIATTTF